MKKVLWWDMDGTLNKFYDVPNWLEKLRAYDASPYEEAEVMHNMSLLARYMNRAQRAGYELGIISWVSMRTTDEYTTAVTSAKLNWLNEHLHSVQFDHIHITEYGTPKHSFMITPHDILFDDNDTIRAEWTGEAYEPDKILPILSELLHEE